MSAQSNGASLASLTGVNLKKMSLPIFSDQRKYRPEFKAVLKQLAEGAHKNNATVQAALEALHKLKPFSESDYRGLVVDIVESASIQLEELNQGPVVRKAINANP